LRYHAFFAIRPDVHTQFFKQIYHTLAAATATAAAAAAAVGILRRKLQNQSEKGKHCRVHITSKYPNGWHGISF